MKRQIMFSGENKAYITIHRLLKNLLKSVYKGIKAWANNGEL